ncbi:MAG: hypothetical protein ABFC30_04110, partial [Proteiniphilum sp.]
AALVDWETHQLHPETEFRFWYQWRAAAFGIPIYRNSGLQRYQDTQILSQGVSSYSTGAALYKKQICNRSHQLAICFSLFTT